MESIITLSIALSVGFGHAFEADHLAAISNIVTRRKKLSHAIWDGIYWGLGHTSTILLIGILMIALRMSFQSELFSFFEAGVGLALILMGLHRLYKLYAPVHAHGDTEHKAHLAYGIGLVHGLAGSGAMVLLVMTKISGTMLSLLYLLIFGLGSVAGMLIAAGIFSLPFSKEVSTHRQVQVALILISSCFCLSYGGWILYENLWG